MQDPQGSVLGPSPINTVLNNLGGGKEKIKQ